MRISDWSSDVCSSDLRHRRNAGEVGGDRVDVVEIHRDRIVGLAAERKRDIGRGRPEHQIDTFERATEVFVNQLADLLRLQVVRVVVAMTEHVGADHDATRSEEHTSELQSLMRISYAVFCLKKKKIL